MFSKAGCSYNSKGDNLLKAQHALLGAIESHLDDSPEPSLKDEITEAEEVVTEPEEAKEEAAAEEVKEVVTKVERSAYLTKGEALRGLEDGSLIRGYLHIHQKNFSQAYIYKGNKRIFIHGFNARNGAVEGDLVFVRPEYYLYKRKHSSGSDETDFVQGTQGQVVFIKHQKKSWIVVGSIKFDNNAKLGNGINNFTISVTSRSKDNSVISITNENMDRMDFDLLEDFMYKIQVFSYKELFKGKILECLGKIGCIETEVNCALAENQCERIPYPPESLKFYPDTSNFCIPPVEYCRREDFRNLCAFSIDPANATDLDDVLSVKELENGNYEIGVHITDVSYFFEPDTIFDDIVKANATSIYFPHKVYHMLPADLVNLISLKPGADKLTFSVLWEFKPDGTIVSYRYARSIINSCAQFSYKQVQKIIDGINNNDVQQCENLPKIFNGFTFKDCLKNIYILLRIANILISKRLDDGFIYTSKVHLTFLLDPETKIPTSYFSDDSTKKSHRIVEEFMFLANVTVAKTLFSTYPDISLVRCHKPPTDFSILRIKEILSRFGVHDKIESPACLYKLQRKDDKQIHSHMMKLVVYNFEKALYCCAKTEENLLHFGLNAPIYTHFTSPIRRYADVVVHRLLSAVIGYTDKPNWSSDYIKSTACVINSMSKNAGLAEDQIEKFFLKLYVKHHGPLFLKCIVMEIKEHYLDVISVDYHFQVRVYFDIVDVTTISDISFDYDSKNVSAVTVKWKNGSCQKISLSSQLDIKVFVSVWQIIEGCLIPPKVKADQDDTGV